MNAGSYSRERALKVSEAITDEIERFNARVAEMRKAGTPLRVDSPGALSHGRIVRYMGANFWLHTGSGSITDSQSWAYCNDGRWAKLLRDAGIERHPLFSEYR